MQQTLNQPLEPKSWYALARCKGIFRYHFRTLGTIVLWVLAVILGSGLLSLLLPLIFPSAEYGGRSGISADVATTMIVALVCGCIVAGRSTRFLLRFGTTRFSVWLCNLLSILAATVALLLGSLAVSVLLSYLALPLTENATSYLQGIIPQRIPYTAEYLSSTLSASIQMLPTQLLWVAEYVSLFYLLGCCLRRAKGWTLAVLIGLPLSFMMLMIIPAVEETVSIAMQADQSELMAMGLQWMQWLAKGLQFVREQWPTIQLIAAVISLPLSYLCMRGTKQP